MARNHDAISFREMDQKFLLVKDIDMKTRMVIEKWYYVPGYDDNEVDDVEVEGFFDKITEFLAGKKEKEAESARTAVASKNVSRLRGICSAGV